MTSKKGIRPLNPDDPLLTYEQAAEVLNTTPRFPRRLVEERRIGFVRIGRFVRIPQSALREFIAAGLVEPVNLHGHSNRRAA
jgi:excisionase family DNA binding protein